MPRMRKAAACDGEEQHAILHGLRQKESDRPSKNMAFKKSGIDSERPEGDIRVLQVSRDMCIMPQPGGCHAARRADADAMRIMREKETRELL